MTSCVFIQWLVRNVKIDLLNLCISIDENLSSLSTYCIHRQGREAIVTSVKIFTSREPTANFFVYLVYLQFWAANFAMKKMLVYWYLFVYNNVGSISVDDQLLLSYSWYYLAYVSSVRKVKFLSSDRCHKSSKKCHLLRSLFSLVFSFSLLHMWAKKHKKSSTGYSFWDRLRNFLLKFTWIVLSVHKFDKLGKFW